LPKSEPAIHEGGTAVRNANRLIEAAKLFDIPRLFTEQNAKGLGATVADVPVEKDRLVHKQFFDACREDRFLEHIPVDGHIIVVGCEAHVCVQQTVLGEASRRTYVVRDALGSRRAEDKETAIRRIERHGAQIVTTEMVVFEWLLTAEHQSFRDAIALIK
jgi:nicotinamidase-related amidase